MAHKKLNSRDHFVSQTYLRYFSSRPDHVYVYRKRTDLSKDLPIEDICTKKGGDICNNFENKLGLREILSKIEPMWNVFIKAIKEKKLSAYFDYINEDGIHFLEKISLYIAYLRCISPTIHRLEKERREEVVNNFILPKIPKLNNGLNDKTRDAIKRSQIKVKVGDINFYKQEAVSMLGDIAKSFYHRKWTILQNQTEIKFITSDTPLISLLNGNLYLPLNPELALLLEYKTDSTIQYKKITKAQVKFLNKSMVQMADDFIILSKADAGILKLVNKYRAYRASVKLKLPNNEDGFQTIFFQHIATIDSE